MNNRSFIEKLSYENSKRLEWLNWIIDGNHETLKEYTAEQLDSTNDFELIQLDIESMNAERVKSLILSGYDIQDADEMYQQGGDVVAAIECIKSCIEETGSDYYGDADLFKFREV